VNENPRYTISLTPQAGRQFKKLPRMEQARIRDCIDGLAINPRPHGCEKLQGRDALYRVRVGDFRVIYEIRDAVLVVVVVLLGHRRDIYRELRDL
jgi:mRNA interferase RelE/StbE